MYHYNAYVLMIIVLVPFIDENSVDLKVYAVIPFWFAQVGDSQGKRQ